MRRFRELLWLGLVGVLVSSFLLLRSFGFLSPSYQVKVQEVPSGDQEIAFIQAATLSSSWERFVTGIRRVKERVPGLHIDATHAFPDQSAAVPEVILSLPDCAGKLRLRWYKLTSEAGIDHWVAELAQREPAPLAVVGGGSSDRARDLAQALARQTTWHGAAPLLLITTATADSIFPGEVVPVQQSLMNLYPGRSYRFCFTNSQMAEAIWDFIWGQNDLRPTNQVYPVLPAAIAHAAGDLLGSLPFLIWGLNQPPPFLVHIVEWTDDPYSRDLANQFRDLFAQPDNLLLNNSFTVPYSVGGLLTPNPREAIVVENLIDFIPALPNARFLLILPAGDKPVRRFLRALTLAAPREVGNVVVVTGDSISFNTLYRDRQLLWNIQELPVPVVSFCHQNPVAWETNPSQDEDRSGTEEILLNADIVQTLVEAAFRLGPAIGPPATAERDRPVLLTSADQLNEQIKQRRLHYFAADGNRRGGSGEYIVCLKPITRAGRVLPQAVLEVWGRRLLGPGHTMWERIRKLEVDYTDPRRGVAGRGAF